MRDFTEKILVDLRNEATRPLPVCRRRKQAVLYIISRENDGLPNSGDRATLASRVLGSDSDEEFLGTGRV